MLPRVTKATNRVTYLFLFPHYVDNIIDLSCMSALVQCLITYHIQFFPSCAEDQIKAEGWRRLLSVAVSFPEGVRRSLVNEAGYFWNKKAHLELEATESFAHPLCFQPPSNCFLSLFLSQSSCVMPGSLLAKYFTDDHDVLVSCLS